MNVVLVTGAATGIGRHSAGHLAGAGYRVLAGVRRPEDAARLESEVPGLKAVLLDVTDPAHRARLVETLEEELEGSRLAGVVNNAGIAVPGPLETLPVDELRRQLDVNVLGLVGVTQICLPFLRRDRGRVVNMGSISGRIAFPFLGAYAASKFAIEAISDSLRQELAPWGIAVALIEPGSVTTPIWEKSGRLDAELFEQSSEAAQRLYGPFRRAFSEAVGRVVNDAVDPSEVTRAVEHALSARRPRTRYLVGRSVRWQAWMARLLPDRWRDRLIRRHLGLASVAAPPHEG